MGSILKNISLINIGSGTTMALILSAGRFLQHEQMNLLVWIGAAMAIAGLAGLLLSSHLEKKRRIKDLEKRLKKLEERKLAGGQ